MAATIDVYERNDPTIVLNLWQDAAKTVALDLRGADDVEFVVKQTGEDEAGDDSAALFVKNFASGVAVDGAEPGNVVTITPTAADLADPGTYRWRLDRLDAGARLTVVEPSPFIIHDT